VYQHGYTRGNKLHNPTLFVFLLLSMAQKNLSVALLVIFYTPSFFGFGVAFYTVETYREKCWKNLM